MEKKILFINPIYTNIFDQPMYNYISSIKGFSSQVDVVSLRGTGPEHLEYNCYEMWVMQDLLGLIVKAEKDGYDASIIGCFYDPGIRAARELTSRMCIVGPAEASLKIASALGERISILVAREKMIPEMYEEVERYGYGKKLASFRVIGMGVHDFQKDHEFTKRRILEETKKAKEDDGADVVVLGCTIEFGFYSEVQEEVGIPVIDPVVASVKYAEFLCELSKICNWSHSKVRGYESPPINELTQFKVFGY